MKTVILTGFLVALTFALSNSACTKPSIPNGSTWVPSPNCPPGPTYEQTSPTRAHCHCYGHCGYICDPIAPVTTAPSGSKCQFGSPWVPPSNPTMICRCQSFNQQSYYRCEEQEEPTEATEATEATEPTEATEATEATEPSNSTTTA